MLWILCCQLASAAEWSVAAGFRDSFTEGGWLEGPRLAGRARAGAVGLELAAYATPTPDRALPGEDDLVALLDRLGGDGAAVPSDLDRATLSLTGAWHVLPAPRTPWRGGPVVVAGVEGRWSDRRSRTLDGDVVTPHLTAGPVLGLGVDGQIGSPLGFRVALLDRMRLDRTLAWEGDGASDSSSLYHDPTLTFDLAWTFGEAP
jgi:hypothetical protein